MLKLPKDVVADPRHDAVARVLANQPQRLWDKGSNQVATLPWTPPLAAELRRALSLGQACQGLELIGDTLAREQKGLDALARKPGQAAQNPRVSRLLFMANDGSTRFYRDCDSLLSRFAQRLVGCRVGVTGEVMGAELVGAPKLVRAVLVVDKQAAAKVLLALVAPD